MTSLTNSKQVSTNSILTNLKQVSTDSILTNLKYILTNPKFYLMLIISIIIIFLLHNTQLQKYMKNHKFNFICLDLDWWSLTHFILYVYFGYFFPEYLLNF